MMKYQHKSDCHPPFHVAIGCTSSLRNVLVREPKCGWLAGVVCTSAS